MQNRAKKWYNNTSTTNAMAAIAIGAMLVFSVAGMKAFADNVVNNVESSDDTVTITEGATTTVSYWIVANNAAGDVRGCNPTSAKPTTVTIVTPDGVTANPSSLTFTDCGNGNSEDVVFSSETAGDYTITVDASGGQTGSQYNETPATFTLAVDEGEPETCPEGQTGTPPNCEEEPPADTSPPVITANIEGTKGQNDWYIDTVTVSWTITDDESSVAPEDTSGCETTTIDEDTTGVELTCEATNSAGLTASESVTIKRDATDPTVSLVGGPEAGEYDFGDVPSAPTCEASDETSGLAGDCTVSGYGDKVGSYTVKATAEDNAGNTAETDSISYKVLAWILKGFYQPVDMNGVLNTVKGGSTVPLKFEIFKQKAGTEITATSAIVTPLKTSKVTCDSGDTIDEIETLATGGTALRYDSTGGQFIYNWQTPKQPGACYNVNIKTIDGTSFSAAAEFKLR